MRDGYWGVEVLFWGDAREFGGFGLDGVGSWGVSGRVMVEGGGDDVDEVESGAWRVRNEMCVCGGAGRGAGEIVALSPTYLSILQDLFFDLTSPTVILQPGMGIFKLLEPVHIHFPSPSPSFSYLTIQPNLPKKPPRKRQMSHFRF